MIQIEPSALSHLSAVLGYNMPIPDAPVTYSHRIGIKEPRFARPVESMVKTPPLKDPNKLKESEKEILDIVNRSVETTPESAAKKTKWTKNHCGMILAALHKRGLIKRVKRTAPNIRFYVYFKL